MARRYGGLGLRSAIVAVVLAVLVAPAMAGEPYTPPKLTPAETLEPPADLRQDAIALLQAVRAGDLDAVGGFIAPKVTVVYGAIDMSYPRGAKTVETSPGGRSAVAALGTHTGGDWTCRLTSTSASSCPTWNSTTSRAH